MPTLHYERGYWRQGLPHIAGLDEAGRGCWAGPVVAAAVVLDPQRAHGHALHGINDSKQLTARQRRARVEQIGGLAWGIGVGVVPASQIDVLGIVGATRLAMWLALLHLPCHVDALLLDALRLPHTRLPQHAIVRGDSLSYSIAAASIIAKVRRDQVMQQAAQGYPGYGFEQHKGYGTARHQAALQRLGACALHRRSFAPVAASIEQHGIL